MILNTDICMGDTGSVIPLYLYTLHQCGHLFKGLHLVFDSRFKLIPQHQAGEEGGREGEMEGGRERGRERWKEGGKEGGRDGRREGGREGRREGGM